MQIRDKWDFQITSEIISIGYKMMLKMPLNILTLQCALRNWSSSFNVHTLNSEKFTEWGMITILLSLEQSV